MVTVTPTHTPRTPPAHTCSAKPTSLPQPKQISVNGVAIDRAEIARETQNHPAGKPIESWMAAARALVVRELLLQEARARGLVPSPLTDAEGRRETDEEALMRGLVEIDVVTPEAGEAECRRYYEHNRERFRSPAIFEARHILLAAAPADRTKRDSARELATTIIEALAIAPERFGELAAVHSACPSARSGGNLGQLSRGQTVPEFETALARIAEPGLVMHPFETRYGFHVVAVDRRIDGAELPFEAVRARIADWLDERVHRIALRQY
ncbi:MAG: peptidylprolyl isomerase, partial [Proteobacteria bacterium]|nr:peptidylprolyl isomerase [Pseudomonadota bacterium]